MTGISFMITQAQKAALRARGLTDEEIANLEPEEAHKILNGGGTLEPDRAEAERFLEALDPMLGSRFTFQTFDDDKERKKLRKTDPFAQIRHGTLGRHWK